MAKKFKGSLTLEWKNKNKSIILQDDGDNTRSTDVPLDTKLHWVNEDESLYYELDSEKGKGKKAYWVDRNDIRVKEVRPLIHKKTYVAKPQSAVETHGKSETHSRASLLEDPSNPQITYTVVESAVPPAPLEGSKGMLIKGDNLLALNALVKHFENRPEEERPKCICIDPPYNTGYAFEQYDDNMEHSEWLTLMRDRLTLLRKILREDGMILINLDDQESHYMRMLCDEIFGRINFIANVIWKKRNGPPNDQIIGTIHENIICYAKNILVNTMNNDSRSDEQLARYKNPDNHPKGSWTAGDLMANVKGGRYVKSLHFPITNPFTGEEHYPGTNGNWRFNKDKIDELIKNNELYFGSDNKGYSFPHFLDSKIEKIRW